MSNAYNGDQAWARSQNGFPPELQIEHEYEFVMASAGPSQLHQQQRHPQQHAPPIQPNPSYQLQNSMFAQAAFPPQHFYTPVQPQAPILHAAQSKLPTLPLNTTFTAQSAYQPPQRHQPMVPGGFDPSFLDPSPAAQQHRPLQHNSADWPEYNGGPAVAAPITASAAANIVMTEPPPSSGSQDPAHQRPGASPQQQPQFAQHLPPHAGSSGSRIPKRPMNHEEADSIGKDGKPKAPRACARCKTLKVKCEFKTEKDPCKRCANGGHECITPGQKKRRAPPKREHLNNTIQQQADEIRRLIAQIERMTTGQDRSLMPQSAAFTQSPQTDTTSPSSPESSGYFNTLSPSSSHGTSSFGSSHADPEIRLKKQDVDDWLATAKQSLAVFDQDLIGASGAMPKSYFQSQDLEDSDSSEYEYGFWEDEDEDEDAEVKDRDGNGDDAKVEYGIAIVDSDGEDVTPEEASEGRQRRLVQRSSTSSLVNTASGSSPGQPKKKLTVANEKLVTIPTEASPFGLMADMSLKQRKTGRKNVEQGGDENEPMGVANKHFFAAINPTPEAKAARALSAQQQAPNILKSHLITPKEAEALFKIYFDYMNISVSLLDPVLYTAQKTCWRSPFLFTVICAISSRYYTERPDLYPKIMNQAQWEAGNALVNGRKNIELCQGYILLSLYPVPARRWEEDRSWLYLGLAIRVATDLNLHHPTTAKPTSENHDREMLNRTRVWLNCFNLDRSTGSQYGKSPIIKNTDYIASHSSEWWKSSPYNMQHFDIHLCCYNADAKLMADFVLKIYSDPNHPTGLNKEIDFEKLAIEADDAFVSLKKKWFNVLDQTDLTDPQNRFRTDLLNLAYSYARLIALSFGFQHAFGKNENENPFLERCLRAASDVVEVFVNNVGRPEQRIYLRHGPEAQAVFVTFASAFLVKLLQPKFSPYFTKEKRLEIRSLVQSVIDLLGSPEVAIDDRHGPKLYARFLKGLLATPMARVDPQPATGAERKPRKAKSQTPDRDFPAPAVDQPSPSTSTTYSLSPPPSSAAMSFDQFAPMDGVDPFGSLTTRRGEDAEPQGDHMDTDAFFSELFQPPLPFDSELVQHMHSLTDPSVWPEIPPGFNWISQYQNQHQFPDNTQLHETYQYGAQS